MSAEPRRGRRGTEGGLTPNRLVRTVVLAMLVLLGAVQGAAAQSLVPLVVGWEGMFSIEWSVGEERGRRVVYGHIVNQSGMSAARIRLLVDALEGERVIGQRVGWLGETLTSGTRAYFTIPVPAQASVYRVAVFDYDIRRGGV